MLAFEGDRRHEDITTLPEVFVKVYLFPSSLISQWQKKKSLYHLGRCELDQATAISSIIL